jgi:hypothetical protein
LDAYHHPTSPRSYFPVFYLLFLCSHIACFGSNFSPFGIKSLKNVKLKRGSKKKLASPSKHSSREMLNTREKIHMKHDPYVWYQWRYHIYE